MRNLIGAGMVGAETNPKLAIRKWAFRVRTGLSMLLLLVSIAGIYRPALANPCAPYPPYALDHDRFGINVVTDYGRSIGDYQVEKLHAGWYVDYQDSVSVKDQAVLEHHGMTHVPVLRVSDLRDLDWRKHIKGLLAEKQGRLYVIGNEPDRDLQDGMSAEEYAQIYHEMYHFIKDEDPSAKVAVAAIVQATPLRLRYLDLILDTYKERYGARLPTDFWNIHAFVLREDDTWGAGIPPGLQAYAHEGKLYELSDHGRIDILVGQITAFREWMAQRGYRSYPLIVSEYGILLPPIYGYTSEVVQAFMVKSFDFFHTAADTATGYPEDDYRLVQAWSWYSLNDYEYDIETGIGFNGNLMDHDSGELTALGKKYAEYTSRTYVEYTDVAINHFAITPEQVASSKAFSMTGSVQVVNRGTVAAGTLEVVLTLSKVGSTDTVEIARETAPAVPARCASVVTTPLTWQADALDKGLYTLTVELVPNPDDVEFLTDNHMMTQTIEVGDFDHWQRIYVPLIRFE